MQTHPSGKALAPRVLIIDDDEGIRDGLKNLLLAAGILADSAPSVEEGLRRSGQRPFDVVILDLCLPGEDALKSIAALRAHPQPAEVVILTGYGTIADAVDAIKRGASDVLEKPVQGDRLLAVVERCLETRQLRCQVDRLRGRLQELTSTELVGVSQGSHEVLKRIDQVAGAVDTTVLIEGESGVGKELVARCIHERSARSSGPFIAINCAALTESLLEAELFGYEPGAFTGAMKEGRDGLFAAAAGGTLFLDEIGEMAANLQAKLLRVLQERSFRRVGGVRDHLAQVRIVASTNRNLEQAVVEQRFRQDLFYRLKVMTIHVPALRQRAADIPLLAHFFLDRFGRQMGKALSGFTEEAMEMLTEHSWPGNVRELKNAVEHAAIVCPGGNIDEAHLPTFSGGLPDGSDRIPRNAILLPAGDSSLRAMEGQLVARVLEETRWNISKAAAVLGINRTTLYNKIRLHGLGSRPRRDHVRTAGSDPMPQPTRAKALIGAGRRG
jgi:DNA-binding NtrC family response regulator